VQFLWPPIQAAVHSCLDTGNKNSELALRPEGQQNFKAGLPNVADQASTSHIK